MISLIVAALACGLALGDSSLLDNNYCNIQVRWSKYCIGINSANQARNMPCSNPNTKFARFPDGSLRLKGREDSCLKKGSSRDMVYGPCSGDYKFNPVRQSRPGVIAELDNSYKVYSVSAKGYAFDIVGTSPKSDASAIFYSPVEKYKESDHYYDFVNCEPVECPVAKASGFYCNGNKGLAQCPDGGLSLPGSSSIVGCSKPGDAAISHGYCKILVHATIAKGQKMCIGFNGSNQGKSMKCSESPKFHLFPDGSLRVLGKEDKGCLRRNDKSRNLEFGKCSGIYTFQPKNKQGKTYPASYKIFSTHPSYKSYAFDVVGTSPLGVTDAILYSPYEDYVGSDHYYDFVECQSFQCPAGFSCRGGSISKLCPL